MPRTNLVCLQPQKEASGRAQCGGGWGGAGLTVSAEEWLGFPSQRRAMPLDGCLETAGWRAGCPWQGWNAPRRGGSSPGQSGRWRVEEVVRFGSV